MRERTVRDGTIEIGCEATEHVSLAYHENAVPVVREIVIRNGAEAELRDVEVRIESRPPVVQPLTLRIDRIAAGASHHVATPDLRLDAVALAGFTEASRLDLAVSLSEAGGARAETVAALRLLPPSHWGGGRSAPELLAAFVRPNDPAVDVILRDAATKLGQAGRATGLDGYGTGTKARVWELAEAIWAALADRRIAYVLPPASFEQTGQKVRGPSDVLERRVGTCLDLSLLYAACLEQAGLHPILVLTTGHAFVGLWLKDEDGASAVLDDRQTLRKRRDLQEMILVETTLLTHAPPAPFAAATARGGSQVDETAAAALDVAIDVRRCRRRGIRPMDLGGARPTALTPAETAPLDQGLSAPPRFHDEEVRRVEPPATGPVDRLDTWKRKLLDLTLRNKLLNFKPGKGSVILDCAEAGALEDRLAAGHVFRLLPAADAPDGADAGGADLPARRSPDDGRHRDLAAALARDEVHTTATQAELDRRLLDLYRLARNGFEEGGANILFLAVGFLQWTRKPGDAAHRAPLLLIPVALQRSSVRAGFRLALHDDEIRINPTLLELLREDFRLRLPEIEGELPRDASGIDVEGIFRIVRGHVRDLRGWEVVPDVVLSAFSFTKYLMWKDLVDRADVLKRNPVVRHLIDTPKHAYGDGASFPEPGRLDTEHPPETVFAPLSADSSQLSAVIAAGAGKDFVLFGPPGTGKSQTIGNMIAQCLAGGRTVLFVSQKTAALEVVRRRLNEIGLGDHCLEVHSTKAQKSSVLAQLRKAWHERATPSQAEWGAATDDLAALRDELNGLVTALHRRRENGMSAYEAFGQVVAAGTTEPAITLAWPDHRAHDAGTRARLRAACRDLRPVLAALGSPVDHPLQGIAATQWSPVWRASMAAAIAAHADALTALRTSGRAFADAIGLGDLPATPAGTRGLVVLGAYLMRPEAPCGAAFLGDATGTCAGRWTHASASARSGTRVSPASPAGTGRASSMATSPCSWPNGSRRRARTCSCAAAGSSASRPRCGPTSRGTCRRTSARTSSASSRSPGTSARAARRRHGSPASAPPGTTPRPERTRSGRPSTGPRRSGSSSPSSDPRPSGSRPCATTSSASSRPRGGRSARADASPWPTRASGTTAAPSPRRERPWAGSPGATIPKRRSRRSRTGSRTAWRGSSYGPRDSAARRGGAPGRPPPGPPATPASTRSSPAWRRAASPPTGPRRSSRRPTPGGGSTGWSPTIPCSPDSCPSATRIRSRASVPPTSGSPSSRNRWCATASAAAAFGADPEWGTLSRELTKKTAHMPLRKLFARMPSALTRLTPCVMMSPLSIAQYLPPDSTLFDVVIFDEASQISPWDAIGAIARGRQVVIVGDPEQLPPTNVGDRGVDEIEDGSDVADQESILDECLAANIPRRNLDWHYRSRHESLIAFSNARYYGGRLVTFPSPVTDDRAVRLTLVRDGLYERGAGRVNRPEARAVVTEIVRRLREPAFAGERRSLGIVTFNGEQQRLIENLLDEQRRAHPDLEPYFDRERWHEPVFVKNLENVQGDERDAILFSVAVGPDASGRVGSTVSSLNKEGGYRRLNVAITRARRELVVFASLRPEQIDLGRTGSRGVRDFKHFLEFAERGPRALAEAFAPTGGDVESPFEAAVMAALENRGWTVHTQIGVSGFRIDLGIVHPDAPGRYLAGIECDGATYHRSATARDRDRLREQVLVDLGWRIRRIWSTEWWMDAAGALEKLDGRLRADMEADRRHGAETQAASAPEADSAPDTPDEAGAVDAAPLAGDLPREAANDAPATDSSAAAEPVRLYAERAPSPVEITPPQPASPPGYRIADLADLGLPLEPAQFHEAAYRPVLAAMIAHVLAVEAPIYEDVLVRRICRAHAIGRVSPPVRDAILDGVDPATTRTDDEGRALLWPTGEAPRPSRRHRPADPSVRSHAETPMPELVGLAETLPAWAPEADRVRFMARALGLSRVEATTRARLERALALAGQTMAP